MSEREARINYSQHSQRQIEAIESRYRMAAETASRLLEGDLVWLDIGPNRGFGLAELSPNNREIFAVDIEPDYLKEALTKNPHVKGAVMDGRHLSLPDSRFNVVTLFEVIEHMGEGEQKQLVREAGRVLAPGGLLILSTPNKIACGQRRLSPDHVRELTFGELESLLIEGGFEVMERMGEGFFNNSFFHRIFRATRENPLIYFAYYHLLPWSLRGRLRDSFLRSQEAPQIRKPRLDEIEKIMIVVCRKTKTI